MDHEFTSNCRMVGSLRWYPGLWPCCLGWRPGCMRWLQSAKQIVLKKSVRLQSKRVGLRRRSDPEAVWPCRRVNPGKPAESWGQTAPRGALGFSLDLMPSACKQDGRDGKQTSSLDGNFDRISSTGYQTRLIFGLVSRSGFSVTLRQEIVTA